MFPVEMLDCAIGELVDSGGNLDLVVTSTKAVKVEAVCQAFQEVFGMARVAGKVGPGDWPNRAKFHLLTSGQ